MKFSIAKNHNDVKQLVKACQKTGYCCYDFETNGEKIYNKDFTPTIISISFQPDSGISVPLNHFETSEYCDKGYDWKFELLYIGKHLIENKDIVKIGHNLKFDEQVYRKYGIVPAGISLDSMLGKYVLDEEKPFGLKDLVRRYLPKYADYEKEDNIDKLPWDKKPLIPLSKYGCLDVILTFRLMIFFENKMMSIGNLYSLFRNLIMPASLVLRETERQGLYVDRAFNEKLLSEYGPKILQAEQNCLNLRKVKKFQKKLIQTRIDNYLDTINNELEELYKDEKSNKKKILSREKKITDINCGIFSTKKEKSLIEPINIGSVNQLKDLLYTKDGFNFDVIKRSKKGSVSTDEDTINDLRLTVEDPSNPKAIFLDNLLEYRGLKQMYKMFILGWNEKLQSDSCLHGRLNIQGTTSGRLSSAEPNVQQIPKTSVDPNIKKQLVAPAGKLYMALDYSQAELRIMAHLSGDETYLKAFREGKDPHLAIAAKKYGEDYEKALSIIESKDHPDKKIWKVRRKQAKQVAFGIIYGIQANLLAVKLSDPKEGIIVTPKQAQEELNEFFKLHPKIKKFMIKQEKILKKHGYITSLFGRRRRLPQVYSDSDYDVAYACRLSVNMPCQSAASDMTLFASILNYWDMRKGKFPMLNETTTVHDAVYYLCDPLDINVWTVHKIWDTCRNPKTKEYFGFEIADVDMSMDFTVGRSMAEELPFIPGYDYRKMLENDFSVESYIEEYQKFKHIEIKDYPKRYSNDIDLIKQRFNNRYR